MKKIFCILLCICMLVSLAACGGEKQITQESDLENDVGSDIEQDTGSEIGSNIDQDAGDGSGIAEDTEKSYQQYEMLQLTVAESRVGCLAFEYDEHDDEYCFYAYDENESLYRVLWHDFSDLSEKGKIVATDCKVTELEYPQGTPDGVFAPQYELKALWIWSETALRLKEIADKTVMDEFGMDLSMLDPRYYLRDGNYQFYYRFMLCGVETTEQYRVELSADGTVVKTEADKNKFSQYLGTDIEKQIPIAIARINEKAGEELPMFLFYFEEDMDGYLCLNVEDIINLKPDDPRYGNTACEDHIHVFYSEKLGKA